MAKDAKNCENGTHHKNGQAHEPKYESCKTLKTIKNGLCIGFRTKPAPNPNPGAHWATFATSGRPLCPSACFRFSKVFPGGDTKASLRGLFKIIIVVFFSGGFMVYCACPGRRRRPPCLEQPPHRWLHTGSGGACEGLSVCILAGLLEGR